MMSLKQRLAVILGKANVIKDTIKLYFLCVCSVRSTVNCWNNQGQREAVWHFAYWSGTQMVKAELNAVTDNHHSSNTTSSFISLDLCSCKLFVCRTSLCTRYLLLSVPPDHCTCGIHGRPWAINCASAWCSTVNRFYHTLKLFSHESSKVFADPQTMFWWGYYHIPVFARTEMLSALLDGFFCHL